MRLYYLNGDKNWNDAGQMQSEEKWRGKRRREDKLICNLKIDIYDLINCISQELTIRIDCHLQFGHRKSVWFGEGAGERETGIEKELNLH